MPGCILAVLPEQEYAQRLYDALLAAAQEVDLQCTSISFDKVAPCGTVVGTHEAHSSVDSCSVGFLPLFSPQFDFGDATILDEVRWCTTGGRPHKHETLAGLCNPRFRLQVERCWLFAQCNTSSLSGTGSFTAQTLSWPI
jgi:hypothetical protein